LKTWNQAATIKHIWHLLTDKGSIWTAWIHAVLLRGRPFWQINIPSNPTWSWRKILQSREWCRGWFITHIGNGFSTSLWYDCWLPNGTRLIDSFSLRSLTATGLSWNSRVSAIITEGHWNFPIGTPQLHACWHSILFQPKPHLDDQYVWKGHASGKFSIHSAWELLREKRPVNNMHNLLWFKGHIPRHSFILWLAGLGRLRTMDRLLSAGIIQNAACILCSLHTETHEHLFFECQFTKTVWQLVNVRAKIHWPCSTWQNLLQWAAANYCKKTHIQHIIARLLLSATVYILWYERNNRVFSNQIQAAPTLVEAIFQQVRTQIASMEYGNNIPPSISDRWGIHPSASQSQLVLQPD